MSIHKWHNDVVGQKVVEALQKNNFDAVYFSNRQDAVEHVLNMIPEGAKVGIGGSMTVAELELPQKIESKGAKLLNHNAPGLSAEERLEIRRQQLLSDVFLSSTNALTLDGFLVNMDGTGNRVAAMTFGPKKVIIIAGINKICKDVHAAYERIREIASPKNNKRLDLPNPCAVTGLCADCQGKTRICNVFSVMKRKPSFTDVTVVVVGEILGY
ncbi:lactate utilization protein [Zhaonella formicivorans]|uniref:lactate utilization protein n=1 Tax=Zhaonella formicivorans TaxID=2528593 RepID=UPI0010D482B0|nr:lactate utilization protein [Zhaonella formicivorans]